MIRTVLCVVLTSNLGLLDAPGTFSQPLNPDFRRILSRT